MPELPEVESVRRQIAPALEGRRLAHGEIEDVRYIGVDTPESVKPGAPVECYGLEASHFNEDLVEGERVRLVFDAERRVSALEVAGSIALDAVAQGQVLRTRRGANRVGLHEAQPVDGALERRHREKTEADRTAAQVGQRHGHGAQCVIPYIR